MNKMVAALLFLTAASITALPSASSVVPETYYTQDLTTYNAADDAKHTITALMQHGGDGGACADLAAETIKEVEDAIDSQQKILDALDNGDKCSKEGQAAVDDAKTARDNAKDASNDADKAAADAADAPVQFPPQPLSSFTEGKCDVFFSNPAFTAAKEAMLAAKKAAEEAKGALKAAEDAVLAAEQAQQKAVNDCYCRVKAAYDKAWTAANSNNDQNEAAYTKGKHMQCILAGTAPTDCQVGDIPTLNPVTLAPGVDEANCDKDAPAPAPAPPTVSEPVANPQGIGTQCKMHDRNSIGDLSPLNKCGSGYQGCHVKESNGAFLKTANKGGCCTGNGGFHRRCHCTTKQRDAIGGPDGCEAACTKDSGCLGWVNANHGCQWATISDKC